ncbi:MAG: EamA family transporter [Clostridium sp.]|nr:EamA family transporter [Clostridium sp.]
MWILFAIGSAFFAGITAILAKIGVKNVNSNVATAIRTVVILIFSWIMVLITNSYQEIAFVDEETLIFLILSGIATGLSWLCYYRALQIGDVNKVVAIDKSSIVLTIILAFIILDEKITFIKFISIIIIVIGTYLMIDKKNEAEYKKNRRWLMFVLLSAIFASLTSILGKIGINNINSNLGTAIRTIIVLIMAWIVVFVTKSHKEIKKIDKRSLKFIILSGITTGLSWLCYYRALQDGYASVVVPLDKFSIVFTVVFSYIFLKEKLNKKAFLGFLLIILGTLCLII